MRLRHSSYFFALVTILCVGCAKRGSITGGLKDTIPPTMKVSFPKNFSTGFKGNEIKLVFDEYVKLKNVNKQLIVSPPMKTAPEISPYNASKTITIKINDTLQPNTTYSFNFGQSIEDNNEGNPYPQFKYVFSTGDYIDSLSLSGTIKDAYNKEAESFVSVMLYEVGDAFNDSIVYKENPRYITNTLDSLKTFRLENLKAGKYLLVAMKDLNSNYKFNPKSEKIAFHKEFVTIPNDTLYEMELFQEETSFTALKTSQAGASKLLMAYEGNPKGITAVVKNGNVIVPSLVTKVPEKDSVNIWHRPIKTDSLMVSVSKGNYTKNFTVKIKEQKGDSLAFSSKQGGTLALRDKFILSASRPLVKIEDSLMKLINKDSVAIPFTTEYDDYNMQLKFNFAVEPLEKYALTVLPGALTDFFEKANDTLQYKFTTKNLSDYGNLRVTLANVKAFPVIVELTNDKGEIMAAAYSDPGENELAKQNATVIDFNALEPMLYTLRVIYDQNRNKVWDTGSFLEKRQSEEVLYFPATIDVRANWDVDQVFTLP